MLKITIANVSAALVEAARQSRAAHMAVTNSLNVTGSQVKKDLREEMKRVFNNPTPFTLNSVFMKPATDANQQVTIWLKDFAPKGTPASKYLSYQIFGGQRVQKRSESALRRRGLISSNQGWVPGAGAQLDRYGNIKPSQVTQILSDLQAFGEQGYRANRNNNKAAKYWVLRKNGTPVAIMNKEGKPVLVFTRSMPVYKPRFDFYGAAQSSFDSHFDRIYSTVSARMMRRRAA